MKISVPTFVLCIVFFFSLFIGCTSVQIEDDCIVESEEDKLTEDEVKKDCQFEATVKSLIIEFTDSTARNLKFSSFDKNKVFVSFKNSPKQLIEFDLITCDTQIINENHWKKRHLRKSQYYSDKKNSLVWAGGAGKRLLKYDEISQESKYYPIESVWRIIPYKEKIYFVNSEGLYVKEKLSEDVIRIDSIPLEKIKSAPLVGKATLILNSKIVYDFETNTWKEEMFPIRKRPKRNNRRIRSLRTQDGIRVFREGEAYCYSTATDLQELMIDKRIVNPKFEIDYPYIYAIGNGHFRNGSFINRYNIETEESIVVKYQTPNIPQYGSMFQYEGDIVWIYRPGQLYFINFVTGEKYNLPIQKGERFWTINFDDCHLYLLYKNKLEIIERAEFIKNCPIFNISDYLAELEEYASFVDSLCITKESSEKYALQKLNLIKEKYTNSIHPEIVVKIKRLNIEAFRSVEYKTIADLQACYRNENLPKEKRVSCFNGVIYRDVEKSKFTRVLKHEAEFDKLVKTKNTHFQSGIDSIRSYVAQDNRIRKSNMSEDSIAFYRAMALDKVCSTTFFCHEGCGGCDYSLAVNTLKKFNKKYPNSLLRDNSEFALVEYSYKNEIGAEEMTDGFKEFKRRYPNSDKMTDTDFKILIGFCHSIEKKDKIGLIEKLESFKRIHSKYEKISQIDWWIRELEGRAAEAKRAENANFKI